MCFYVYDCIRVYSTDTLTHTGIHMRYFWTLHLFGCWPTSQESPEIINRNACGAPSLHSWGGGGEKHFWKITPNLRLNESSVLFLVTKWTIGYWRYCGRQSRLPGETTKRGKKNFWKWQNALHFVLDRLLHHGSNKKIGYSYSCRMKRNGMWLYGAVDRWG